MNETILVVDDDAAVRDFVRKVLELEGYRVLDADDGAHALFICNAFAAPPDLIISDIMMPEVNGGQLLRELTRAGHPPRVILMSGYVDASDRDVPFISKPFTGEALSRKIREVLDG